MHVTDDMIPSWNLLALRHGLNELVYAAHGPYMEAREAHPAPERITFDFAYDDAHGTRYRVTMEKAVSP